MYFHPHDTIKGSAEAGYSDSFMPTQRESDPRSKFASPIALQTVVKAKQSDRSVWKDMAEIHSVSSSGAGFYIRRYCHVGQLLSLIMPLPRHLRLYDENTKLYRVWGLVQHCSPVYGNDGAAGFHVGVAFVGKNPPVSYEMDPMQSYRICGMSKDGMWRIEEAETPFQPRRHSRFWNTLEVYISVLDADQKPSQGEATVTENISESGASVITSLNAFVGDRIQIQNKQHNFTSLAVVRNRKLGADDRPRLHVEFIDAEFPVHCLPHPNSEAAK